MLSSRYRFHGYGSLKFVYKNGRTIRSAHFSLRSCPNPRRKNSRIAVVVGKKVAKKAVQRNFIRRRLFEVIRQEIINEKRAHDIVFTAFDTEIAQMDYGELSKTVHRLLAQAQIIS